MTWMHERAHASRTRRRTTAPTPSLDQTAADPGPAALRPEEAGRLGIPHILGRRARWMTARLRPGTRA
ncbi:hypothetical protein [Peterkaempfera bronchialis]|uniref:Uncharacterized protein n=1 Tax=Peterkaempfera bronchialis TaxID=2126346 RepID=A0A345SYK8_9ACTN|nr:hypothetical protein [Peterkaempfera bronchialis]AXI78813.1 hypothetical protein C7M71_016700 [Peterkaempfera bronchialis]